MVEKILVVAAGLLVVIAGYWFINSKLHFYAYKLVWIPLSLIGGLYFGVRAIAVYGYNEGFTWGVAGFLFLAVTCFYAGYALYVMPLKEFKKFP